VSLYQVKKLSFGLLTLGVALVQVCAAQTVAANDPVLKDFLSWYKAYRGSFMPLDVAKAYSEKLGKDGLDQAAIAQRMGALQAAVGSMPPEYAALHFDHIYMAPDPPFKTEASQFLARAIEDRKPGKALDVAMGQGRNTLYLASKGWDVTGYDISEEGMAIANANAAKAKLTIHTVIASHAKFDYGQEQWDLIVETFAFTDLANAEYRKRVVDSLKPGGLLVIEGFGNPSGKGPKNVLFESFKDLRVIDYQDKDDVADWGKRKMRLSRIAAQKD
jgi:predicted TPR repeat methyltransferase